MSAGAEQITVLLKATEANYRGCKGGGGVKASACSPLFFPNKDLCHFSVVFFFLGNFLPITKPFLLTSMEINCANWKQVFQSPYSFKSTGRVSFW